VTTSVDDVAVAVLAAWDVLAAAAELVAAEVVGAEVTAAVDEALEVVAKVDALLVLAGAADDDADEGAAWVVAGAIEAGVDAAAGAAAEPPQAASATLPRAASPTTRSASRRDKDDGADGRGIADPLFACCR
jgi:hypothetical protein